MTAIIGFCLSTGAFLAADSARMDLTSRKLWDQPVKKIMPLNDNLVIATGGLGTLGHAARDSLIAETQNRGLDFPAALNRAVEVFSDTFVKSKIQYPGHSVPLTCIIAGRDNEGKGVIVAIGSSNNFEPFWVRTPGAPYFTGSNTRLVMQAASNEIYTLRHQSEALPLDLWAVRSVARIREADPAVDFPLQLVLVRDGIYDVNVENDHRFERSSIFETEFPVL